MRLSRQIVASSFIACRAHLHRYGVVLLLLSLQLYFACRNCPYQQIATTACVAVNEIKQSLTANLNVSRDTTLDPALKRTRAVQCAKCGNQEACFFARSDENLELVFVCTDPECAYHWTQSKAAEENKA